MDLYSFQTQSRARASLNVIDCLPAQNISCIKICAMFPGTSLSRVRNRRLPGSITLTAYSSRGKIFQVCLLWVHPLRRLYWHRGHLYSYLLTTGRCSHSINPAARTFVHSGRSVAFKSSKRLHPSHVSTLSITTPIHTSSAMKMRSALDNALHGESSVESER